MVRRSLAAVLATVAAVAMLGGACGRGAAQDEGAATSTTLAPQHGGSVVFGIEADPNGLDPVRNAWDTAGLEVGNALYDTLTAYDDQGNVKPYLLASLDHDADYLSWTLNLRPGVTFHDGSALTPEVVVNFVQGVRSSPIMGPAAANVKDVAKTGDLAVTVSFLRPWASYPAHLTGQAGTVAAQAQLDDPYGHSHPIGTGPFKLQTWDQGKDVKLVRNPSYWRKGADGARLPYLDAVDFRIVPDLNQRTSMLRRGDLDLFTVRTSTRSELMEALATEPGFAVEHDTGATETQFVQFNTSRPPLDDLRIRQALAYATDTEQLARELGWPQDRITNTLFSPSTPYFAQVGSLGFDLAKAKQLVQEYRRDTGKDPAITLSHASDDELAAALARMWTAAGVTTQREAVDVKRQVLLAVTGKFDAQTFAYGSFDPDLIAFFFHSSSIGANGVGLNYTRLSDPAIDAALETGRESPDLATRQAAYTRLQQRWAELVPYLFFVRVDWMVASRAAVHDAHNVSLPDGSGASPFKLGVFRLTETWVQS